MSRIVQQRINQQLVNEVVTVPASRSASVFRLADEGPRLAEMKMAATPPAAMAAAPVAPARGTMRLQSDWVILTGGTRRLSGAHWVEPSALDVENHFATRQGTDAAPRAPLFTPGQLAMASRYRALVEWRTGSAIKCAKLDGGAGGPDGRDYMDSFIAMGNELDRMQAAIGTDVALSPRRHMDRDNARRPITVRAAVDALALKDWTISQTLRKHGWVTKGETRKAMRDAIRGALDRMQGY